LAKKSTDISDRGDAVWLNFSIKAGHEQSGRRPAVVDSPRSYNTKVGLGLFCYITSQIKGYPFEVVIPAGLSISGVELSDQSKSLNWRVSDAQFICTLSESTMSEILKKLSTLLKE
jgi:mRNA interferase MazF